MRIQAQVREDDDHWFVACAPAFPGCSARGHTKTEAIQNLKSIIRDHLKTQKPQKKPTSPPVPRAPFPGIEETQSEIYRLLASHTREERIRIMRSVAALLGDVELGVKGNSATREQPQRDDTLSKVLECLRWITPDGRVSFL